MTAPATAPDWESHLTEDERERLAAIDAERDALTTERGRIYERARKRARRAPAAPASPLPLHLVACVASKLDHPAEARELYRSPWFKKARAYVEAIGAPWAILSAKHGIINPAKVIAPYDETLNAMTRAERLAWGEPIARGLVAHGAPVVMLAGRQYRDAITDTAPAPGLVVSAPMVGLGIGEQMAWLAQQTAAALRK